MALREILAKFGFDVDEKKLDTASEKTDGLAGKVKELAGLYLGEQLVQGVKGFIDDMSGMADQLQDTSNRLGLNAQELQRWNLAAKLSGAEAAHVGVGFRNLQKNADAAVNGAKTQAETFERLGVKLEGVNGALKPSSQLMREVGIALSGLGDESERNALAMKVFGEAGLALGPMFSEGAEGLDTLLGKLDELGGGLGDDALGVLTDSGDLLDELDTSILSLKSRLSVTLVPALNETIGWFTKVVVGISKATEGTNVFQAAALILGVVIAKVAIGMYAKFIPLIAIIALIVLVVEDLITLFKGGDSVIGRFIDSLFGVGTTKKLVEELQALWKRFFGDLDKFPTLGAKIEAVFTRLASALISWIDGIGEDFSQAWDFLVKDAEQFADDIIDGIVNGLKNGWDKVTNTFKDLGKGMMKSIRGVFDSHSPSRVMDRFMDQDVGGGAVQGLARAAIKIQTQAQATFGKALPGASSTFAPSIKVQGQSGTGGPVAYHVDQRNNIALTFPVSGSADGLRIAAREGLGDALGDERRAMLASLESLAEI